MVFRLPDEFGYPSKRDLHGCDRYGVIQFINPYFKCFLERPFRNRHITFIPDV